MEKQKPERLYPEHLYDPLRRRIATELVEKEFGKQFPTSFNAATWAQQFDEHTFWNAIEGLMGGTLIKPVVHFLTARNYTWSRQSMSVADITLSSKLEQLNRLPGLDPHELYLSHIQQILAQNPAEALLQKEITDSFSQNDAQNHYLPLIVETGGRPMVMDGNRRCLRALLYGQETIEAWYCQTNSEKPVDFWFPIDDMMGLIRIYNNGKGQDPQLGAQIGAVLREIFRQSRVAKIAYQTRIVAHSARGAQELLLLMDAADTSE